MPLVILLMLAFTLALSAVDTEAKQERSQTAKSEFKRGNPCPSTGKSKGACPGYQVDHRKPLASGGADHKSNMQWLSNNQHRAKTKAERKACEYGCGSKGSTKSYSTKSYSTKSYSSRDRSRK
jgi:hypothetical protein